jgi:Chalcone isomerase-like
MIPGMNKKLALAFTLVLSTRLAAAVEISGVKLPDTISADGKTLTLNGAGVRKKAIFKVYVAALYLERASKDASAILASPESKSMRLHILRDLKSAQITDAISEGFERNSKEQLPKLQDRLKQLAQLIPDVAEGDEVGLTWVSDKGTVVTVRGTERGTITGRDFADALFAVWLGPDPVQQDLKMALLGG